MEEIGARHVGIFRVNALLRFRFEECNVLKPVK